MDTWLKRGATAAAALGLWLAADRALTARARRDLEGQVTLITGGSSGLGLLLAHEFGRAGCRVAISARDGAELERARDYLTARGVAAFAVRCDVSDREDVARLIEAVTDHFGRIDVLVNNAGIISVGPVGVLTLADYEAAMAV